MGVLSTRLDPGSEAFRAGAEAMAEKLAEVRALEDRVRANSARKAEDFAARGQLLPRERVARLVDPEASFIEISPLAGLGMHDDDGDRSASGGGSILGIGTVSGRRAVIAASDSAIKGGTVAPMGLKKALRGQEIAFENRLPLIHLVESGGANLLYQAEIFVEGGRSFANQARLSAAGIPQVAVVHGSSTAGGAYLPGLSDYVVLVRDRSKIFLAGPPLVKAAIGEDADDEALGGARLHAETTGLGEYLADDDAQAIAYARALMAKIGWEADAPARGGPPPVHDPGELMGLIPADGRAPFDAREVIARIADGSDFLEFKPGYGAETVCGHASLGGHPVGIVTNNGPIQPEGSAKAGQFIQLCDQTGIALVFLQNTTGYMVGTAAEAAGAVKHGSKMIQAVANARVPKLTIVMGGSYGAGNYGMCGRGFDPRFIFAWPTARTAVMGGAQAAKVMEIVTRAKDARAGRETDETALRQMSDMITAGLEDQSRALFGTARLWDDGIIDPRDTRAILIECLETGAAAQTRTLRPNTFGAARF
ncbi:acyl-CoA carboxylase subunit beta [Glycocaulis profundi]|nr:acyl-CoA carboxylase subunit beta [Glycocaulis profundi]